MRSLVGDKSPTLTWTIFLSLSYIWSWIYPLFLGIFREGGHKPQAFYGFFRNALPYKTKVKFSFGAISHRSARINPTPYDSIDNPLNQYTTGQTWNAYISFEGSRGEYQLSDRYWLISGYWKWNTIPMGQWKNQMRNQSCSILAGIKSYLGKIHPTPTQLPNFIQILTNDGFWMFALYTGFKNYEIGGSD